MMTTDLIMLTASAVLTGALVLPYGLAMWTLWPVREVLGNRETPPPLPPWAERARLPFRDRHRLRVRVGQPLRPNGPSAIAVQATALLG